MSDETLNQNNNEVLKAIADLAGNFENKFQSLENKFQSLENKFDAFESRFDKFEKSTNAQFEAIREGIIYNNVRFERLTARSL